LIARVTPNIGWVDPDVEWYQAVLNLSTGQSLTGYIQRTNTLATPIWTSDCVNPTALGTPARATSMPAAPALATFASVPPVANLFDGNQPPAVMGACGIHNPICVTGPNSSTIDVVPRNIEFCIDTRSMADPACNPGYSVTPDPNLNPTPTRVPVYAMRQGCASYAGSTLQLRLDHAANQVACDSAIVLYDRLIAYTHITTTLSFPSSGRLFVPAGALLGYICPTTSPCGITPGASPHLAFQLQFYIGSSYQPAPQDILGYLAYSKCLYDDWSYRQPSPQPQTTPIRACP
jgi:hypothetical protein